MILCQDQNKLMKWMRNSEIDLQKLQLDIGEVSSKIVWFDCLVNSTNNTCSKIFAAKRGHYLFI